MNVYEAIAKSPVGVAWHKEISEVAKRGWGLEGLHKYYPDGWQPLYTSPAEYTLGEPLTEAKRGERYITISKTSGMIDQGTFAMSCLIEDKSRTYYADPRPMPKMPEVKEEPELFVSGLNGRNYLTDEGRRRLERLLRESEGE